MDAAEHFFEDILTRSLRARIQVERETLLREEACERTLVSQRKQMLVSGTDDELDAMESRIGTSRNLQVRTLERIQLLEQFLLDTEELADAR